MIPDKLRTSGKRRRFTKLFLGGINRKLILTFILVAIIPIMIITYINFNSEIGKVALETNHINSLEAIADLKVKQIETFFNEVYEDMIIAQDYFNIRTNLPILIDLVNDKNNEDYKKSKQALDSQLKQFQQTKDYVLDVLLLDPSGNIMYVTGNVHKDDEIGSLFPKKDVIEEGISQIHFTEVFKSPFFDEGFEILISGPVYNLNDNLIGIIVFGIDMASVYEIVQDYTGLSETGETLIGKMMYSHDGETMKGHFTEKVGNHALFLNPLRHDSEAALNRAAFFDEENAYPIKEVAQELLFLKLC
jgi:hypothetical protein